MTGGSLRIAPDESYIIFASSDLDGGMGGKDHHIGYRKRDGRWGLPNDLGSSINASHHDLCPFVSPDGRFLFFLGIRGAGRESDVYWVDASFIEQLRLEEAD